MIRTGWIGGVLVLAITLASLNTARAQIAWQTDFEAARQQASRENRLLLFHFWKENCPPCLRLEHAVFNRPEVARSIAAGYIPVKINTDQFPQVARQFGIRATPTDVLLTPQGRVLHRDTSPQDPQRFAAVLDQVARAGSLPAQVASAPGAGPAGHGTHSSNVSTGTTQWGTAPGGAVTAAPPGAANGRFMPNSPAVPGSSARPPGTTWPPNSGGPANGTPSFGTAELAGTDRFPPSASTAAPGPNSGARPATQSVLPPGPADRGAGGPFAAGPTNPPQGPASRGPDATQIGWNPAPSSDLGLATDHQRTGGFSAPGTSNGGRPGTAMVGPGGMTPEAVRSPGIQPAAFALEGCCPVTLLEKNQWTAGDRRYGVVHRQCTYLFAGPTEQQRFYQDPDRYSPALSGMDPVKFVEARQLVPGKRSHGVVFEDRIYLFQDEPSLQRFADSPQRYIAIVAQAQGEGSR